MNTDKCTFSAKVLNRSVCRLAGTVTECDGALRGKTCCPFWNIAHQLCRMGGGKV